MQPEQSRASGRRSSWRRAQALSVLPTRAKCQCLVPPAQISELLAVANEGTGDVTQDPAALRLGWETSVPPGSPFLPKK